MSKTFRAVEQGFYDGKLVNEGATFSAHDDFEPNWAVEVTDHKETPSNAGDQEAIAAALAPELPTIDEPQVPLPAFHPTANVLGSDKVKLSTDAASLTAEGEGTPIATAGLTSTSDPAKAGKSTKRPGTENGGTGTAPSPAEEANAKQSSAQEAEAGEQADEAEHDASGLV